LSGLSMLEDKKRGIFPAPVHSRKSVRESGHGAGGAPTHLKTYPYFGCCWPAMRAHAAHAFCFLHSDSAIIVCFLHSASAPPSKH